jgi:hypothetical protein
MYIISELTGKIYLNGVNIPLDDSTQEFQQYILDRDIIGIEYIEATEEELIEANKEKVPESISRMHLKIELLKRDITIQDIIASVNSIPDSMFSRLEKDIAIMKFNEASTFDRYNADLNFVATMEGLSQEDLDNIFINGNKS